MALDWAISRRSRGRGVRRAGRLDYFLFWRCQWRDLENHRCWCRGRRFLTVNRSPRSARLPLRPLTRKIYAGTGETDIRSDLSSGNGVYKSTDGGATWTHVGLEDTRQISRIVVDPQDANVVYVGALGHAYGPNEQRGVYKSVDGGAHWDKVLDQGPEIGVSDLAICSSNPDNLVCRSMAYASPPMEHLCSDRRTWRRSVSFAGCRQNMVATQRKRTARWRLGTCRCRRGRRMASAFMQ